MTKEEEKELERMARESDEELHEFNDDPKIYLHWTAGVYGNPSDDYHICIDEDGSLEIMCDSLAEVKAHTWGRNTGNIGIAIEACYGAVAYEDDESYYAHLGEYPPTDAQIEAMINICTILCRELDIPPENIFTHAEAANEDEYGLDDDDPDCRWDGALWRDGEGFGEGGTIIRKAVREKLQRRI